MSTVEIGFFGWYYNTKENSDKIWGWLDVGGAYYYFWARRGGNLQFKRATSKAEVTTKALQKQKKGGYRQVYSDFDTVYPNFQHTVERQLFKAKLQAKV